MNIYNVRTSRKITRILFKSTRMTEIAIVQVGLLHSWLWETLFTDVVRANMDIRK